MFPKFLFKILVVLYAGAGYSVFAIFTRPEVSWYTVVGLHVPVVLLTLGVWLNRKEAPAKRFLYFATACYCFGFGIGLAGFIIGRQEEPPRLPPKMLGD
jgi:hypothetical protein